MGRIIDHCENIPKTVFLVKKHIIEYIATQQNQDSTGFEGLRG
jgi:hypothetical protein